MGTSQSEQCLFNDILLENSTLTYLRRKLNKWGNSNLESYPWRLSKNEFHTLVAEIFLQRTKASQVTPVYLKFVEKYPDPKSLTMATVSDVEQLIRPLGLVWRAKLLLKLAQALKIYRYHVPSNIQTLVTLPGVGPYVASAYLSLHRGKRAAIVDSNIIRFYGRFFGFVTGPETRRNSDLIKLAELLTPERKVKEFNYSLLDFSRRVCSPKAHHETCAVKSKCVHYSSIS